MELLEIIASAYARLIVWNRGDGEFVGRFRTHDSASQNKKPFIIDMPAQMLKKHAKLSKQARMLYCCMRALANGKTGELSIRGAPLDWQFIRKQAQICRNVWQRLLRELLASGLVSCTRERLFVYKNGRKRAVLGRAHYFVHKLPKTIKKPRILLKPLSCTVQERGTQVFSNPPYTDPALALGSPLQQESDQSSSPKKDDDARASYSDQTTKRNPTASPFMSGDDEILVRDVQERLHEQYPQTFDRNKDKIGNPLFVLEAIQMIDQRGGSAVSVPEAYFTVGIAKILDSETDMLAISDILTRKDYLRKKYMPRLEELSPEQEKARREFNAMVEGGCKPS